MEATNGSDQHKSWEAILEDLVKEDYTAKPEEIQSLKVKYKKKTLSNLVWNCVSL